MDQERLNAMSNVNVKNIYRQCRVSTAGNKQVAGAKGTLASPLWAWQSFFCSNPSSTNRQRSYILQLNAGNGAVTDVFGHTLTVCQSQKAGDVCGRR